MGKNNSQFVYFFIHPTNLLIDNLLYAKLHTRFLGYGEQAHGSWPKSSMLSWETQFHRHMKISVLTFWIDRERVLSMGT